MVNKRGSYARRVTEVKAHQASERRDECRYSNDSTEKRYFSIKGQQSPTNAMPPLNLRHQLIRDCQRYYADIDNEAILRDAKDIVKAGIARGLVYAAVEPSEEPISISRVALKF